MTTRRKFLEQTAASSALMVAGDQLAEAAEPSEPRRKGEPVRLALVGTGQIAPRFLRQAAAGNRARFVATCARTLESAKARAIEHGIDAWFDDYQTMYDKVRPDGVVIATPSSLHAEHAIAAMERGIHVLCEKPMATAFADCQAMVEAARRNDTVFLCLPYEGAPATLAALAHLNERTLGVFTGAEALAMLPGHGRDNWFYDGAMAGGASLDTLVYAVSRLINFFGPARRVTGIVNTLIPHRLVDGKTVESTIDDNATLIIEWANGQQGVVRTLWGTSIWRFNDTVIYGRKGTLWVTGNDVVVHSPKHPISGGIPIAWGPYEQCYRVPVEPVANEGLIDHFVDCIQGLRPPLCGPEQQLHVHEILFKGYEASRRGQAQELTTTFIPGPAVDPVFLDTRSRAI